MGHGKGAAKSFVNLNYIYETYSTRNIVDSSMSIVLCPILVTRWQRKDLPEYCSSMPPDWKSLNTSLVYKLRANLPTRSFVRNFFFLKYGVVSFILLHHLLPVAWSDT